MAELNAPVPWPVLLAIISGRAASRARIARLTGLARSTVGNHVELLVGRGILIERDSVVEGRGRPPAQLQPGPSAPAIGVVDLSSQTRIAICNIAGETIRHTRLPLSMAENGPAELIPGLTRTLSSLARQSLDSTGPLMQVVVSVPHPVSSSGELARTARMADWAGVPLARILADQLEVPVEVDNDANVRALGVAEALGPDALPLVYAHLSVGIGLGIVTREGQVYRGATGSAGDISHVPVPSAAGVSCVCGRLGCVVAVAGVDRIVGRASESDLLSLAQRVLSGDADAMSHLRAAGVAIGELLGMITDFYNSRTIAIGGELGLLQDQLLPTVRSVVYERALPLATRELAIAPTPHDRDDVVRGALIIGRDLVMASDRFRDMLR
jgi:predicted NBD/HSP70 family sugar kinase